jgi:hypothetical protein
MNNVCQFINSLPHYVTTMKKEQTKRFTNKCSTDIQLDASFSEFVNSVQSLKCDLDSNDSLHLEMTRYFGEEESLEGKVSEDMQAFVWALGYSTIGCVLFHRDSDYSKIENKKDSIFFLASIFRDTQPHVRSLQSIAFEAVEKCHLTKKQQQILSCMTNANPTLSKTDGLEYTKNSSTKSYPEPFLVHDSYVDHPSCFCGPTHAEVHSFIFTTSLAFLEDNITIYNDTVSEPFLHIVYLTLYKIAQANLLLVTLLQTCFIRMSNQSSMLTYSIFGDVLGMQLSVPSQFRQSNQTLESHMELVISNLNSTTYTHNCFCRSCQEMEAAFKACISFTERHVVSLFIGVTH